MLVTSASQVTAYEAKGYGVVLRRGDGWVEMRHRSDGCLHPMRGGACGLDRGHRGRHATQVFYCDACRTHRRGQPPAADEHVAFCFLCTRRATPREGGDALAG